MFRQAYENGIQSARLQLCLSADVVPIPPLLRSFEKDVEHLNRLQRQSKGKRIAELSLHM